MTWRGHEVGETREKKGIKQSSIQSGLKKNSIHNYNNRCSTTNIQLL